MIFSELADWAWGLARWTPGRAGRRLRAALCGARFGARPHLEEGLIVTGGENISAGDYFSTGQHCALHANDGGSIKIGSHVSLNRNVLIDAAQGGRVELGSDIMIGPNVVIRASNHGHADKTKPMRLQGHEAGLIVVEDGVWLASNVVLLPGVRVGKHSIIAAGAVVTRDVPPYSVAGGVPAKVLKER